MDGAEATFRLQEKTWLYDIDLVAAIDRYRHNFRRSRSVEVGFSDDQGEVEVRFDAVDPKALWRVVRKFKMVFAPWLIATNNRPLEAEFYGLLKRKNWHVSTAESVTGGMIASRILDNPGASDILNEAYVVYTDDTKTSVLGVNRQVIIEHGSVSLETAKEMAEKCALKAKTQVAIATTGIAGPSGGTEQVPVGTVIFGFQIEAECILAKRQFSGSRNAIRRKATAFALGAVIKIIQEGSNAL